MIFDGHKAVFFHIGKTAGYSIEQFLLPDERDYRIYDEEVVYGLHKGVMTQHATPQYVVQLTKGRIPDITDYFWFTFVRNPWDRMVSAYCYLRPAHDKKHGGFDNWLTRVSESLCNGGLIEGGHYTPQVKYTHDSDGDAMMDFVGKFENLTEDWSFVCDKLGITPAPLSEMNKSRLRENRHYSEFYNQETRDIVANMYREDIDIFGYGF